MLLMGILMNKSCLQIQNYANYLLKELDCPKRKARLKKSEFIDYFMSIKKSLNNIVELNEKALTSANLAQIMVPKRYMNDFTEQGVLNAFYEIEISFWSVIWYCENSIREDGEIKKLKNLIIQTVSKIIDEMSGLEIIKNNIMVFFQPYYYDSP